MTGWIIKHQNEYVSNIEQISDNEVDYYLTDNIEQAQIFLENPNTFLNTSDFVCYGINKNNLQILQLNIEFV